MHTNSASHCNFKDMPALLEILVETSFTPPVTKAAVAAAHLAKESRRVVSRQRGSSTREPSHGCLTWNIKMELPSRPLPMQEALRAKTFSQSFRPGSRGRFAIHEALMNWLHNTRSEMNYPTEVPWSSCKYWKGMTPCWLPCSFCQLLPWNVMANSTYW